jgi:ADP-heptose:LPS heptosyltransferase
MSTHLLLENNQAPGDTLMFTCLARDIHKTYPGQFQISVISKSMDIWKNNPNVVSGNAIPNKTHIRIGYSSSISQSNQRSAHFSTGFIQDFNEKTGLHVRLTDMRPDLYFTEEEKNPDIVPVKKPYWLMMAGGKRDFTAKIWDPGYYQRVVTLTPEVQFVQVGAANHVHRRLNGVVDLLGKTSLRQLMLLIYHAEGIVCPVTCGMHFAAAMNKPCVVISGGREPWWWEAYNKTTWGINVPGVECPPDFVEHHFLHTIGSLGCCTRGGCWKNGIGENIMARSCRHPVNGPTMVQPACMAAITPEMVSQTIRNIRDNKSPVPLEIPSLKPPLFTEPLVVPKKLLAVVKPKQAPAVVPKGNSNINKRKRMPGYIPRTHPPAVPAQPTPSYPKPRPAPAIRLGIPKKITPYRRVISPPILQTQSKQVEPLAMSPVTIAVLTYGDYTDLVSRCVKSIYDSVDTSLFKLRLGLNAASSNTHKWVDSWLLPKGNVQITRSDANIYKYPIMHRMFHDTPLDTQWVIWFDDDSFVTHMDWLKKLNGVIGMENPDVVGKRYFMHLHPGTVQWAQQAKWWRNKPLDTRGGRPISNFATGGWWAMKTEIIKRLDIPDPRLKNQGDVEIGICNAQNNLKLCNYSYGITISGAKRRGASQKRAGCA